MTARLSAGGATAAPDLTPYIGLPYRLGGRDRDGIDCYGLVRLALGEVWGLDLPAYAVGYPASPSARQALAARVAACRTGEWLPVTRGHERPGDVVLIAMAGQPCHMGLVVAPAGAGGRMLHILPGQMSVIDRYADSPVWAPRVVEFGRHLGLCAEAPI